eukprot:10338075-Prorocentrum_lima.AAC.1
MNQRLMELVHHHQVIQGVLPPINSWVVSPPIGGVSGLARRIRDEHPEQNRSQRLLSPGRLRMSSTGSRKR